MNLPFSVFIVLFLMTSRFGRKSTFDQNGKLQKVGKPEKIGYNFEHLNTFP
jgi:hypothetical protein